MSSGRRKNVDMSHELLELKEKVGLKKVDRELLFRDQEDLRNSILNERTALHIGNQCLAYMEDQAMKMPIAKNAAIFENHRLKDRMKTIPLQESIKVNDHLLFTYGKQLLREDHRSAQNLASLKEGENMLAAARIDAIFEADEYDEKCQAFLHKQAMVENSLDHEVAAKLIHKRLRKIFEELSKDIQALPGRIEKKGKQIAALGKELEEFTALRDRAKKYEALESENIEPLNKELVQVAQHFNLALVRAKAEIEERKKNGALAKFLAQREANAINFGDVPNIMEVQYKRRNKMEQVYDIINKLKSAAMVSDIGNIVDCFEDQNDVGTLLAQEKELQEHKKKQYTAILAARSRSHVFLKYNDSLGAEQNERYNAMVAQEIELQRQLEIPFRQLEKVDKLTSNILLSVHAMALKLRPVGLEADHNRMRNDLLADMGIVVKKAKKMVEIVKENTVPIGPVKPTMLSFYKLERVPNDCLPIEIQTNSGSMASLQTYLLDNPHSPSRDFLKVQSKQILQENTKKKKKN